MLKAGFARCDITPPLGAPMAGYFSKRNAKGILDPLEANAVAVSSGEETLIFVAVDLLGMTRSYIDRIRAAIAERVGIPAGNIFLASLHQHTSCVLHDGRTISYRDAAGLDVLLRRIADAAVMAVDDLRDATGEVGERVLAEPIAFVRRYLAKDGSIHTNPRADVPLAGRCDEADNTVRLVRFRRTGAADIAILSFSTHPDVIGGEKFSADWPGFARRYLEAAIPGTSCLFFTGVQGDSNHINYLVPPNERFRNGGRYGHADYMGRTVADAAVAIWDSLSPIVGEEIFARECTVYNRTNTEGAEDYDRYRAWYNEYEAGRIQTPHITELAYASRIIRLRGASIWQGVPLSLFGIGNLRFVGFGGEAFTAYGDAVRALLPGCFTLTSVCTNGYEGYLPTAKAFREGGYETASSLFTPTLEQEILDAFRGMIENK